MSHRSRRSYDHPIKKQIIRSGDPAFLPELEIPRSTSRPAGAGALRFALAISPGVDVSAVGYEITGSDILPLTGSLAAGDGTGNTFVAIVNDIPPGVGRKIALSANASNGETCSGEAMFDVIAGQTTTVTVVLECGGGDASAVLVNGSFNQCPHIRSVMAAPASAAVGERVSVSVVATDSDNDPITTRWTASAGSFDDATTAATHFLCTAAGTELLTVTVSQRGSCSRSVSLDVVCTAAGDAGARCGNGVIDTGEQCDMTNLNGQTCASATMNAMPGGTLRCSTLCLLDTSRCTRAGDGGIWGGRFARRHGRARRGAGRRRRPPLIRRS